MNLHIITPVLDGMPFIAWHLPVLNQLHWDWTWHVVEGQSRNTHCTGWCKPMPPRLSRDGTHEYLQSISKHPRVRLTESPSWDGKVEMFNTVLEHIKEPCVLMELDVDELWTAAGIESLDCELLQLGVVQLTVRCRYFVGWNLWITTKDTYGNNGSYEWRRLWNYQPGMRFKTHEPPFLEGASDRNRFIDRYCFDHYAYVTEAQLRYKEAFYGYENATSHWRALQNNKLWPAPLKAFFPWVKDNAMVDQLTR